MSDLELNKVAAGVLIGGLIAMAVGTVANVLYKPEIDPEKRGYSIEVAEDTGGDAGGVAEEVIDIATLLAAADAENGKKVAKKCLSCHTFEKGGAHKTGPNLYNIIGDKFASSDDFKYSKAFYALNGGWDYGNLFEFLRKPKKYVKGTKMSFAGIKKPEDIADLLLYMRQQGDNQPPLPEVKVPEVEVPTEENQEAEALDESAKAVVEEIEDVAEEAEELVEDATEEIRDIVGETDEILEETLQPAAGNDAGNTEENPTEFDMSPVFE